MGLLAVLLTPTASRGQDAGPAATAKRKGTFEPEGRISLRQFIQIDDARVPIDYAPDADTPAPTQALGVVPAITTLDADLRLRRINGTGLGFLLDFEYRHDMTDSLSDPLPLSENRLELDLGERRDRSLGRLRNDLYIKSAYAEYERLLGGIDVQVGRMLMYEQGQTWIDGVHVHRPASPSSGGAKTAAGEPAGGGGGLGWGVFGGLSPNPMTYAFDPEYMGGGAHLRYERSRGYARLASTYTMFGGKKDRAFVNSSAHWQLVDGLFASYNATLDLFAFKEVEEGIAIVTKPQITSAFGNIAWWVTPMVQFRLTGAMYRNVLFVSSQQESLDGLLGDLIEAQPPGSPQRTQAELAQQTYDKYLGRFIDQVPYYRGMLTTVFKFLDHYYAYNELGMRHRDRDDSSASTVGFGLRDRDVLGSGTFLHLRFRFKDSFASDTSESLFDLRRQFGGLFTAGVSATHLSGRSLALNPPIDLIRELGQDAAIQAQVERLEQRQDVTILSADVDVDLTDRLYLTLAYELTVETPTDEEKDGADADNKDLTIQAFNGRLTWRL